MRQGHNECRLFAELALNSYHPFDVSQNDCSHYSERQRHGETIEDMGDVFRGDPVPVGTDRAADPECPADGVHRWQAGASHHATVTYGRQSRRLYFARGLEPGLEILYPVATVNLGGLVTSTFCEFLLHPGLFWEFSGKDALKFARTGDVENAF